MTAPILVTGATGTLGGAVVTRLADAGRKARALSRRPRPNGPGEVEWMTGDLRTGAGLDQAVSGAAAIIHCATDSRTPTSRVKLEVERLVERSGLPWTILRATQFHDLVHSVLRQLARPPVMVVPAGTSFQPVGAGEVAARLVELAEGAPGGRAPDFGGPEVLTATELARADLRARGRRRRVVAVRVPAKIARGYRQGGHLAPDHADGRETYADFLARA